MKRTVIIGLISALCFSGIAVSAQSISARDGWITTPTSHSYTDLTAALKSAVKAEGLSVVTQAGPTQAAARRGITIPGNRVLGVFNNDYAVRVLSLSTAAMIEAPIRFYVTENKDATATLSYKTPSFVFAPYVDEGGEALVAIAQELDGKFAAIATAATQ